MKRIYSFAVLILLFLVNAMSVTLTTRAELDGWGENIDISPNENRSIDPTIASWDTNVHVVYAEDKGGSPPIEKRLIWYVGSNDNGDTWNPRIRLDEDPTHALEPKIAVWENKIHVIWYEYGDNALHYVRSLDNGITWSSEKTIAAESYNSRWSHDIAVNNSFIHVSYSSSDLKVSYVRSVDDGNTWSASIKLIATNSSTSQTAVAVFGPNVHIVWKDTKRAGLSPLGYPIRDIFYIKSEDNGLTWINDIDITQTPLNRSNLLEIDVDENNIYVVYTQDDGIYQLYFSYSRDNGNAWEKNIKLTNSTKNVFAPSITVTKENIYLVWRDRRDGGNEIYFKSSSDNGKNWDISTRITDFGGCYYPEIASSENWVHVVWWKWWVSGDEGDIFYKRYKVPHSPLKAIVNIDPDTLNLKSKGRWITAYIELEEGHDVNDINLSTILLENSVPAEYHPTEIGDYDNDGIPDLMVKFDRSDVEDMLTPSESVTLKITGSLKTDEVFEGSDDIRVIWPP